MKTNRLFFHFLIAFTSILSSCSITDPIPQSAFSQDRRIIEIDEIVTFTNRSKNYKRIEWNFGDGQVSTEQNPAVQYNKLGTYTVTLTTYNNRDLPSVTSSTVTVGERYLNRVKITKINFLNSAGNSWDPTNGPDLILSAKKAGTNFWPMYYIFSSNATPELLPMELMPGVNQVKFERGLWEFFLDDSDDFGVKENMASWLLDPTTVGQKDYQNGFGSFFLRHEGNEVELSFFIM